MTIVSSTEDDIMCATDNVDAYDEILEPDEDFYRALSGEEFKRRALEMVERVHNMYAKR